jgi:hypothetical protein
MSFLSVLRREPEVPAAAPEQRQSGDTSLVFMLAQQAMTRWQFETALLENALPQEAAATAEAAEATAAQIAALAERVEPYVDFVDMAVRFEAQEILAAIVALQERLSRIVRIAKPDVPFRDAAELVDALLARRH